MTRFIGGAALATAIGATLATVPCRSDACSFPEEVVFSFLHRPDMPLDLFASGRLGLLPPTLARSYLATAFVILDGRRFEPEEVRSLVALWEQRGMRIRDWEKDAEQVDLWFAARNAIPNAVPSSADTVWKSGGHQYTMFINCNDDAFRTATATLQERVANFGTSSPQVREWLAAQDQVFTNCGEGPSIPPPLSPEQPLLSRRDRAYQIGAAHFYAGNYDQAIAAFRAIADDTESPWRPLAAYVGVRAMVRKALFASEVDQEGLRKAQGELDRILGDPSFAQVHTAASALRNLVRLRLFPPYQMVHELAAFVTVKQHGHSLGRDLGDLTWVLDKLTPAEFPRCRYGSDGRENEATRDERTTLAKSMLADDITDWVLTFQAEGPDAQRHAVERFSSTGRLPWLVASLAKISATDVGSDELVAAALRVAADSPAHAVLCYHAARILGERGSASRARNLLDRILALDASVLSCSDRNRVLALRMGLARDLSDLVRFAPRSPCAIGYMPESGPERRDEEAARPSLLDDDAARFFNFSLPLRLLQRSGEDTRLSRPLREQLLGSAWTRAFLIGDTRLTLGLSRTILNFIDGTPPDWNMRPDYAPMIDNHRGIFALKKRFEEFLQTENASERRFVGALLLLDGERLRPYVVSGLEALADPRWRSFHSDTGSAYDGWWTSQFKLMGADWHRSSLESAGAAAPRIFLSDAESRTAARELARLGEVGPAPNVLGKIVIGWARAHRNDPRVPEALHLVVMATSPRWGSRGDSETGRWTQAAFRLLHRRYPNSEWAHRTPYWY